MSKEVKIGIVFVLACWLFIAIRVAPVAGASLYKVFGVRVEARDVPGAYVAKANWGRATLQIATDGSFQERVFQDGKQTAVILGKWSVSPEGRSNTNIVFTKFLAVTHDSQGTEVSSGDFSIGKGPFGYTSIAADPDYGISFEK
jgi:hypothetical protein